MLTVAPTAIPCSPIKLLIVESSPVLLKLISRELMRDGQIRVTGGAVDLKSAWVKVAEQQPDVILLDCESPTLDGIQFLRQLMERQPIPVIVLGSDSGQGALIAMDALDAGALDVLCKPTSSCPIEDLALTLIEKIKAVSTAKLARSGEQSIQTGALPIIQVESNEIILAVGAGTGGVRAVTEILTRLPANTPPMVLVQQMPAGFTAAFARRLAGKCAVDVKEAVDGDTLKFGRVLIAPGGMHTLVRRCSDGFCVQIKDGPQVLHRKPSIDILFNSIAKTAGANAVGAILSGSGSDGIAGLLNMRKTGAHTLVQDTDSCISSETPRQAIASGATERVARLAGIPGALIELASHRPVYRTAQ